MPIIPEWQDRRGLFQRGREMHEPSARRASESSSDALSQTTTNQSSASSSSKDAGPAVDYNPDYGSQHRRRVSACHGFFSTFTDGGLG